MIGNVIGNEIKHSAEDDGYITYAYFDIHKRYSPEVLRLPVKQTMLDVSSASITLEKQIVTYKNNYLEGNKAQYKYLPATAYLQNEYIRAGFDTLKKQVRVASQSIEIEINENFYGKDTPIGRMENAKVSLFRDSTWDLFWETIDGSVYNGSSFHNPNIAKDEGFTSFASESLDPTDVGLPSTITGGSATELVDLVNKAISFLKKSGGTTTRERDILIIVGSDIYRQNYGVISGAGQYLGMPTLPNVIGANPTYQFTIVHSEFLGNDMIICDKNEIEIVYAHSYDFEIAPGRYKREKYTALASSGLGSVALYNPEKSLFYRDVLQESAANRKVVEKKAEERMRQKASKEQRSLQDNINHRNELNLAIEKQQKQMETKQLEATLTTDSV